MHSTSPSHVFVVVILKKNDRCNNTEAVSIGRFHQRVCCSLSYSFLTRKPTLTATFPFPKKDKFHASGSRYHRDGYRKDTAGGDPSEHTFEKLRLVSDFCLTGLFQTVKNGKNIIHFSIVHNRTTNKTGEVTAFFICR